MKYITPEWPVPTHIKAYTTVKAGWGQMKPNQTLERETLHELLNLPTEPIWLTQTHSTIPIEATPENKEKIADASYTKQPNRVCVVMTADCLPILITNIQGTVVAALHAGWRGLAAGIIENTLATLKTPAEEIIVWLGPAIGPSKFEVGPDVFDAFTQNDPRCATAFIPTGVEQWQANLYELARMRFKSEGVNHLFGGDFCTYTHDDLFFSYRRDRGHAGRMASLIWIAEN